MVWSPRIYKIKKLNGSFLLSLISLHFILALKNVLKSIVVWTNRRKVFSAIFKSFKKNLKFQQFSTEDISGNRCLLLFYYLWQTKRITTSSMRVTMWVCVCECMYRGEVEVRKDSFIRDKDEHWRQAEAAKVQNIKNYRTVSDGKAMKGFFFLLFFRDFSLPFSIFIFFLMLQPLLWCDAVLTGLF